MIKIEDRAINKVGDAIVSTDVRIPQELGVTKHATWLMESFVDRAHYAGTCYQAANWIRVGRTQGRGRQDRFRHARETVKDIYVYPLEKDFRSKLGLAAD